MERSAELLKFIHSIEEQQILEETFGPYLLYPSQVNEEQVKRWKANLAILLSKIGVDEREAAVEVFLNMIATNINNQQIGPMLEFLEAAVPDVLSARNLCITILNHYHLALDQQDYWLGCFSLIRRLLPKVDYKGIREIMNLILKKSENLPRSFPASFHPQISALESILTEIFSRKSALLPSYFIITELQKSFISPDKVPHWKLSQLLSDVVDTFRPLAQMISVVGHSNLRPVVQHTGVSNVPTSWLLDRHTLKFLLRGHLPYDDDLLQPQRELLHYVLDQPNSKYLVHSMLSLTFQHPPGQQRTQHHCSALEDHLVKLLMQAMEAAEEDSSHVENLWNHVSSQLMHFTHAQFACFPTIVTSLNDKLKSFQDLRKGRDRLMWILLQFISRSAQKSPIQNFLPALTLYDSLYPEDQPIPLPDCKQPSCVYEMAAVSVWIHILRKATVENFNVNRSIPVAIFGHYQYFQDLVNPNVVLRKIPDFTTVLLCNAFSTNNEHFARPLAVLVDALLGPKNPKLIAPSIPLAMDILDGLSIHSKMSFMYSLGTHIVRSAQARIANALSPALVETYARLLIYPEIDSVGNKWLLTRLLPSVFQANCWGILLTILEILSFRLHHVLPSYRAQVINSLQGLMSANQTNQFQLNLYLEGTALRMITGLRASDAIPYLAKEYPDPKKLVFLHTEELNRVLILTVAKSFKMSGIEDPWGLQLLRKIMETNAITWGKHTLVTFPVAMQHLFKENPVPKRNKVYLKKAIDEEYRNWAAMSNENDIIRHFSLPGAPLFLCLVWKMILETDMVTPIVYKILERIGARSITTHIRKFCDYLVFEFANSAGGETQVNKCIDAVNHMIWKYDIVPIDTLVLCLALRGHDGNEAQVCFFIIQLLLLKSSELRNRVQEVVKEYSKEHWQVNGHEKHLRYQRKYPEAFASAAVGEASPNLPVFFGNVCFRLLPVFDIVIHRYLEIPQVYKSLETILEHLGALYNLHEKPVCFLYETLYYHEQILRIQPELKQCLVSTVLGSSKTTSDLSKDFLDYLAKAREIWVPGPPYFIDLIRKFVQVMQESPHASTIDWRFHEFPNPGAHALYLSCVQLMTLPVPPDFVGTCLLDVVTRGFPMIPQTDIHAWINCIGLLMASLPEVYTDVFFDRLVETVRNGGLLHWRYPQTPFQLFNFKTVHFAMLETKFAYVIALAHSIWYHKDLASITKIPLMLRRRLLPIVQTEEQFIFVCHVIGPMLVRLSVERFNCVLEIARVLYAMLEKVDSRGEMKYADPVCDLLYHIKYMFVGDAIREDVEGIVKNLRPELQKRLRFVVSASQQSGTVSG